MHSILLTLCVGELIYCNYDEMLTMLDVCQTALEESLSFFSGLVNLSLDYKMQTHLLLKHIRSTQAARSVGPLLMP